MELRLDKTDMQSIVKQVALEIAQQLQDTQLPDELMNKSELCKKVLHCDTKSFDDNYRYAFGFPFILNGKKRMYSRKAVEKWIASNQKTDR